MKFRNEERNVILSTRNEIMTWESKAKLPPYSQQINSELIEEFTKGLPGKYLSCGLIVPPCVLILYLISHLDPAASGIAFTRVDHARELHRASRGFDAHNEPVSGGQNGLINPPETARVMRRLLIITRAFAISCIGSYRAANLLEGIKEADTAIGNSVFLRLKTKFR